MRAIFWEALSVADTGARRLMLGDIKSMCARVISRRRFADRMSMANMANLNWIKHLL